MESTGVCFWNSLDDCCITLGLALGYIFKDYDKFSSTLLLMVIVILMVIYYCIVFWTPIFTIYKNWCVSMIILWMLVIAVLTLIGYVSWKELNFDWVFVLFMAPTVLWSLYALSLNIYVYCKN